MNATELFKAGQLQQAIDAQVQVVKSKPADQGARIFLFELLCFAGDLDRAQRQIEAVKYEEMEREAAVLEYRKLLDSERLRRRLFTEGLKPKFFFDPPQHVTLRLEALNCLRDNQPGEAAELVARADQAAPPVKGNLNGQAFDGLRDCDDLFGPILEVMALGEYYWLALEQIDTVAKSQPSSPRDLCWAPARLEVREGPAGDVFLPALYPNSHVHADDQVKLGRMTDWTNPEQGPVRGIGARMFLLGDDAINLLEWRQLQMG
jgi:type VI secretion system protein ImpE